MGGPLSELRKKGGKSQKVPALTVTKENYREKNQAKKGEKGGGKEHKK